MEQLNEQAATKNQLDATIPLYTNAYSVFLSRQTQKENDDASEFSNATAQTEEQRTSKASCESEFPSPGGFRSSLQDLSEKTEQIKNTKSINRRNEQVEDAIIILTHLADTKCSSVLNMDDLKQFKNTPELTPSAKDLTQHVIDNFDSLASFSDVDEIEDPLAREIAEGIFATDGNSKRVISAVDVNNMRSLNPLSLAFLGIKLRERSYLRLEKEPEETQRRTLNELSSYLERKLREREKLLNWR